MLFGAVWEGVLSQAIKRAYLQKRFYNLRLLLLHCHHVEYCSGPITILPVLAPLPFILSTAAGVILLKL